MALSWWDIPGPNRFVRRVENDLRDHINVIAALPIGMGREWFRFFRHHWTDQYQERIEVIQIEDGKRPPLEILSELFTTNPEGTTTLSSLTRDACFQGLTIAVLLRQNDPVREWSEFLSSYERACQTIDPMDRSVILIITDGSRPTLLPSPETLLRIHVYDGYAQSHDCYMYSWNLLGSKEKQTWRMELKMALCAQLAQWDPRLCEEFAERNIRSILSCDTSVNALPKGQEIQSANNPDECWACGILQRKDGKEIFHSGWVAQKLDSREFKRRVWTAQVQVIFPLLEQLRQQAVDRYGDRFPMPVQLGINESIEDPYELEISAVSRLIHRLHNVPRGVTRRLDQALKFRNLLAHLEPLTAQQLEEFEPTLE